MRAVGQDHEAVAGVQVALDVGLVAVVGPRMMEDSRRTVASQPHSEPEGSRRHSRHHVERPFLWQEATAGAIAFAQRAYQMGKVAGACPQPGRRKLGKAL